MLANRERPEELGQWTQAHDFQVWIGEPLEPEMELVVVQVERTSTTVPSNKSTCESGDAIRMSHADGVLASQLRPAYADWVVAKWSIMKSCKSQSRPKFALRTW